MAHHRRHRTKQQRAGCLMCKPWKANCTKDGKEARRASERRRLQPDERHGRVA